MDDERTTSLGMWRYGNDFLLAATTILNKHHEKGFMPYYFLIGQSIELSLKGYLLAKGVKLKTLRYDYGHNLNKLLNLALEKDLITSVNLDNTHIGAIELLSKEYLDKRFQFIKTGVMQLPLTQYIHEAGKILSSNLESTCFDATEKQNI